jgi:hypothetical protein
MFNINPLDVLKKRKLSYMPSHFSKFKVSEMDFIDSHLENWIFNKLKGRFAINKIPMISQDNKLKVSIVVGFENQKELTFFMLACPYLRRTQ